MDRKSLALGEPVEADAVPRQAVPTSPLSAAVARSVVELRFADVPNDVIEMAKNCLLDTIGVAIAGAAEPTVRILRNALAPAAGRCVLMGDHLRADPVQAAFINGTAAHALDFDDLSMTAMGGHPSAPLLPAVLAAAEGKAASGQRLLAAFVAGYELQARLGLALGADHYERGFHSTATLGVFGAAAGAGHVLGLDAGQMAGALSLAAAQSAGLKRMFGTMGKPLQVGRAASSGLLAARLMAGGYDAPAEAIAGRGGFAELYAPGLDSGFLLDPLSSYWHIRDNLYKEHASCYGTHATIDALERLRSSLPRLDTITSIVLRVPPGHETVCCIHPATTGLEGKFSLSYTAALALVRGSADVSQFNDANVSDPQIQALAALVQVEPDSSLPELGTHVTVTEIDGRTHMAEVDSIADGTARSPQEHWDRIESKFRHLVRPVLGAETVDALIQTISHLETFEDVRALAALAALPNDPLTRAGATNDH